MSEDSGSDLTWPGKCRDCIDSAKKVTVAAQ